MHKLASGDYANAQSCAFAALVAIRLEVAAVYTRVGQTVFGTVALTGLDRLVCIGLAGTIVVGDGILRGLGLRGDPARPFAARRGHALVRQGSCSLALHGEAVLPSEG